MTKSVRRPAVQDTVFLNPSILGWCHLMLHASLKFVTFYKWLLKKKKRQVALPSLPSVIVFSV